MLVLIHKLQRCCIFAAQVPRIARLTAMKKAAVVAEATGHLHNLTALSCHCLHAQRADATAWQPLVAGAAREALLWVGHSAEGPGIVRRALLYVADSLRNEGNTDYAMHAYFALVDGWDSWDAYDAVRCSTTCIVRMACVMHWKWQRYQHMLDGESTWTAECMQAT